MDFTGWVPPEMKIAAIVVAVLSVALIVVSVRLLTVSTKVHCTFDRNELGPMGDHGQWYWDIYKCDDGTERRQLVASPRG